MKFSALLATTQPYVQQQHGNKKELGFGLLLKGGHTDITSEEQQPREPCSQSSYVRERKRKSAKFMNCTEFKLLSFLNWWYKFQNYYVSLIVTTRENPIVVIQNNTIMQKNTGTKRHQNNLKSSRKRDKIMDLQNNQEKNYKMALLSPYLSIIPININKLNFSFSF